MAFRVRSQSHDNQIGRDPTIWILEDEADRDGDRLEIWPALGFNAYRWRDAGGNELLYRDPAFFDGAKPTRSGWPILFPFPNRIRDGQFTWEGRTYQLPKSDSTGKNAIHGFAFNRPWRIVDQGADARHAWLTAEFWASRDAADATALWPADYVLRVSYRLSASRLRVEAAVENPGQQPLPFGLGYHPYFAVTPFGDDRACVEIAAGKEWRLEESLPTGAQVSFNWPQQRFGQVQLDHLLTDVPISRAEARECGAMESPSGRRLVVEAARDFREVVVFTPPHRQAICFEPYTCTTDAINLHERGVDAGLRILPPGDRWQGWVEVNVVQDSAPAA